MSARAWSAFAAVSVLWGIPYLFIKVAVDDGIPPAVVAWVRVMLAAVILLALAWRAGTLDQLRGVGRWVLAYAVVEISIPFPLIGFGEQHVSSSLAAIVIAAVPLIVALLALRFVPEERVDAKRLTGLLLGFGGVVALVGIDATGSAKELLGAGAILLAACGYACGPMLLSTKLAHVDARALMGAALACASVVLAPLALLTWPQQAPSVNGVVAILVLGLFCTAAAFVFYAMLNSEVGAGRAVVITYVAPIVAVTLGVAVLGEHIGPGAIAGLLLILAGSWLSTDGRVPPGVAAIWSRPRGAATRRAPGAHDVVDSAALRSVPGG